MKIQLTKDVPVAPKHGMRAGRVFAVTRERDEHVRGGAPWYVMGDAGEEVGVFGYEAIRVPDDTPIDAAPVDVGGDDAQHPTV